MRAIRQEPFPALKATSTPTKVPSKSNREKCQDSPLWNLGDSQLLTEFAEAFSKFF